MARNTSFEILIDPGAVGTSFSSQFFSPTDLNGTALNGQTLDLDFVFADMKHLEPSFLANSPGAYQVHFTMFHNLRSDPGDPTSATGFLSDENGDPVTSIVSASATANASTLIVSMSFLPSIADGLPCSHVR